MTKNLLALLLWASASAPAQNHAQHDPTAGGEEPSPPMVGSGTSWLPASSPMEMLHFSSGEWNFMVHGFANFAYQEESEPRRHIGVVQHEHGNVLRGAGRRRWRFRFSLHGFARADTRADGLPIVVPNGRDRRRRQSSFRSPAPSRPAHGGCVPLRGSIGRADSLFFYFAPVGDPAIGPTAFMHRFSGVDNPVAPLSHHWLDATHISYGVLTLGWTREGKVMLEGSIFNGAEPDADRWDVDDIKLDSFSARITVNPTPNLSIQASIGLIKGPEQLHPDQDLLRITASVTHNKALGGDSRWGNWQTTAAWGRNKWDAPLPNASGIVRGHVHFTPGVQPTRNAVLAETGLRFKGMHTVFARWEWAEKDELFITADRRHQLVYNIQKLNAGYLIDFLRLSHVRVGAGVYGAVHWAPDDLVFVYGERPTSYGFFVRLKII